MPLGLLATCISFAFFQMGQFEGLQGPQRDFSSLKSKTCAGLLGSQASQRDLKSFEALTWPAGWPFPARCMMFTGFLNVLNALQRLAKYTNLPEEAGRNGVSFLWPPQTLDTKTSKNQ